MVKKMMKLFKGLGTPRKDLQVTIDRGCREAMQDFNNDDISVLSKNERSDDVKEQQNVVAPSKSSVLTLFDNPPAVYRKLHTDEHFDKNISIREVLDLVFLFTKENDGKHNKSNNPEENVKEQPTVSPTLLFDFYRRNFFGCEATNSFQKIVEVFGVAMWFLSGCFSFVFPLVFAILYFDRFTLVMKILWYSWAITLFLVLLLLPSYFRYHITCLLSNCGLGSFEIFKNCEQHKKTLETTYFSVPIRALREVFISSDKVMPRDCFDKHVACFLDQQHFGLYKGDETKFKEVAKMILVKKRG